MKLAILNADTIADPLGARYGQYPDMFAASLQPHLPEWLCVPFDVHKGHYPHDASAFSGFLITGSQASAFEREPWIEALKAYVRHLVERGHKLVGICFGHQLIAEALGGQVERAAGGWCVGVHAATLNSAALRLGATGERFNLLSSHRDQVVRPAPDTQVLAATARCPVSVTALDDRVLTFQGHPEFSKAYARALMDKQHADIGEPLYRDGIASLAEPLDHERVNHWIARFLTR